LKNGDFITIESEANMHELFSLRPASSIQTHTSSTAVYTNKLYKINIVDCVRNDSLSDTATSFSTVEVNAEESELISNIKLMAISALASNRHVDAQNCHLRYINENSESIDELRMFHLAGEFADSLNLQSSGQADTPPFTDKTVKTDYSLLGTCLCDDSALGELVQPVNSKTAADTLDPEQKFLFLLCSERAPVKANNECVIKCYREDAANATRLVTLNASQHVEIVVNLVETKVVDLTEMIAAQMGLERLSEDAVRNGECYYLKKLDWLGDVHAVLNNVNQTCAEANLEHNLSLLITNGKTFVRFFNINSNL
jgi:hypothetical protein